MKAPDWIHFPTPSAEHQAGIWRSLLPEEALVEVAKDEWEELGEDYELTGGHIRNAVLTPATLAAIWDRPIGVEELREGAFREYRALGRVVRRA